MGMLFVELEAEGGCGRPGSTPGTCGPGGVGCGNWEGFAVDFRFDPRPKPLKVRFIEFIRIPQGVYVMWGQQRLSQVAGYFGAAPARYYQA
jgi:hypothetical protein